MILSEIKDFIFSRVCLSAKDVRSAVELHYKNQMDVAVAFFLHEGLRDEAFHLVEDLSPHPELVPYLIPELQPLFAHSFDHIQGVRNLLRLHSFAKEHRIEWIEDIALNSLDSEEKLSNIEASYDVKGGIISEAKDLDAQLFLDHFAPVLEQNDISDLVELLKESDSESKIPVIAKRHSNRVYSLSLKSEKSPTLVKRSKFLNSRFLFGAALFVASASAFSNPAHASDLDSSFQSKTQPMKNNILVEKLKQQSIAKLSSQFSFTQQDANFEWKDSSQKKTITKKFFINENFASFSADQIKEQLIISMITSVENTFSNQNLRYYNFYDIAGKIKSEEKLNEVVNSLSDKIVQLVMTQAFNNFFVNQ